MKLLFASGMNVLTVPTKGWHLPSTSARVNSDCCDHRPSRNLTKGKVQGEEDQEQKASVP